MPDGHHWSDKRGQLGGDFASCALPRVGDRFGAIAGNHDRLFVADIHNDDASLRVLGNPEVLQGLYQGGHRGIATENFPMAYNRLFEGYYNGGISAGAMRYFVENAPTNLGTDMELGEEGAKAHMKLYADIVENARANNLRFGGLSAAEGMVAPEQYESVVRIQDMAGRAIYDAAAIIDRTDGFMTMTEEQKRQVIDQGLTEKGWEPTMREEVIRVAGLGEEKDITISGDMERDEMMRYYADRLDHDDIIAGRIDDFATEVGGGVTTLYGGLHLWRAGVSDGEYGTIGRDIDDSIGSDRSAVISVFSDSKEFWQSFKPQIDGTLDTLGIRLENAGDYQLDMKNGKWYDGRTDTDCTVQLPEALKPGGTNPVEPSVGIAPPRNVFEGIKW